MDVFDRNTVFVVSTGRTGTQFFGSMLERMIDGCKSVHEPDYLWGERLHEWPEKVRKYGLFNLTFGLFDPKRSVYMLNAERVRGRVSDRSAADHLKAIRHRLMSEVSSDIFVEANPQLLGLVSVIPRVFPKCRIIVIVRDPRTWIRSVMNSRTFPMYSGLDVRNWFGLRIRAGDFNEDPYRDRWSKMTLFEKRCWYWNKANGFALEHRPDRTSRVFRFEDLFYGERRDDTWHGLLSFATDFRDFRGSYIYKPELLVKKVHSTAEKGSFPPWREWDEEHVRIMDRHCGSLMRVFHYGEEPQWRGHPGA